MYSSPEWQQISESKFGRYRYFHNVDFLTLTRIISTKSDAQEAFKWLNAAIHNSGWLKKNKRLQER